MFLFAGVYFGVSEEMTAGGKGLLTDGTKMGAFAVWGGGSCSGH